MSKDPKNPHGPGGDGHDAGDECVSIEECIDGDYEGCTLSPEEIIDETVRYYSEDLSRRAYVKGLGCQYLTEDGRMCAVGRCLGNVEEIARHYNAGYMVCNIFESVKFKPQYRGLNVEFWNDLQSLHDPCAYWDGGLTESGQEWVDAMKSMAKQGHYYPG